MRARRFALAAARTLAPLPAFAQRSPSSTGPLNIQTIDSGFVIAPEARLTEILNAGVRCRATGDADLRHEQLRGVSGSFALRFGGH